LIKPHNTTYLTGGGGGHHDVVVKGRSGWIVGADEVNETGFVTAVVWRGARLLRVK